MADEAIIRLRVEGLGFSEDIAVGDARQGLAGGSAARSSNPRIANYRREAKEKAEIASVAERVRGHVKRKGVGWLVGRSGLGSAVGGAARAGGAIGGLIGERRGVVDDEGKRRFGKKGRQMGAMRGAAAAGRTAGITAGVVGAIQSGPQLLELAERLFSPGMLSQIKIGGVSLGDMFEAFSDSASQLAAGVGGTIATMGALKNAYADFSEANIRMTPGIASAIAREEASKIRAHTERAEARKLDQAHGFDFDQETLDAILEGIAANPSKLIQAIKTGIEQAGSSFFG